MQILSKNVSAEFIFWRSTQRLASQLSINQLSSNLSQHILNLLFTLPNYILCDSVIAAGHHVIACMTYNFVEIKNPDFNHSFFLTLAEQS